MKWYSIIVSILLALAIVYIVLRKPKTVNEPIPQFKPDTALIREVVNLKAERNNLVYENEILKQRINAFQYKKPANINGSDSDLAKGFRAVLHQVR